MSGSDWGTCSKSCCKTPLGNVAVSTAWQISPGPATSSTTGVWNVLCHILSRAEEEAMRECDIHDTRSIKTNSAVKLSRQPGLELCRDLLQHLQGVPRTCSFYIILRTLTLLVSSLHSVLTYNNIMHILPLPPCGSYSIRAQNGYGQHRPCKIVLLTLVAPRGVTDLNISWGITIEHARTAYDETCGTEYQHPYRGCNSQPPYYEWNIAQARPMSVSYVSRSWQSWVSTTHRSYSQLTFFNIFIKSTSPWGRPHEVAQVTRNFGGVTTST